MNAQYVQTYFCQVSQSNPWSDIVKQFGMIGFVSLHQPAAECSSSAFVEFEFFSIQVYKCTTVYAFNQADFKSGTQLG